MMNVVALCAVCFIFCCGFAPDAFTLKKHGPDKKTDVFPLQVRLPFDIETGLS